MATCHWHPERETGLTCGNCGKPICVECLRQHPVGIRCKECSRPTQLPTHQISVSYMARGIAATLSLGVVGGIALAFLQALFPFVGFLFFFLMFGLGHLIGEGLSSAVNRRRGRPYQYMAGGAVLIATLPMIVGILLFGTLSLSSLFALAGIAVAVSVAVRRLAP